MHRGGPRKSNAREYTRKKEGANLTGGYRRSSGFLRVVVRDSVEFSCQKKKKRKTWRIEWMTCTRYERHALDYTDVLCIDVLCIDVLCIDVLCIDVLCIDAHDTSA